MKYCTQCRLDKDISHFSSRGICKSCKTIYNKEYYKQNSEKIKTQNKEYNLKNPEKLKLWARKHSDINGHKEWNQYKDFNLKKANRKIIEKHGDIFVLDTITFKGTKTKARFVDKDYGEHWITPEAVIAGQGHPTRGRLNAKKNIALSLEEVKSRLYDIHGDLVIIDESTFTKGTVKAKFIDKEYGEWWQKPSAILASGYRHTKAKYQNMLRYSHPDGYINPMQDPINKEKARVTMLRKYGVEHNAQNREFAIKTAKSLNNSGTLFHWKTSEELVFVASYEKATIEFLNKNQIDFKWQPEVFKVPLNICTTLKGNQTTYRPDLFLIKENKYIEIKGYFREEQARLKWEWFHRTYPNSELWMKNELMNKGIL